MPVFTEFHYNQVIITFIFKAIAEIVFMNVFSLTERAEAETLLNCWKLCSQSFTNESFNSSFQLFGSVKKKSSRM